EAEGRAGSNAVGKNFEYIGRLTDKLGGRRMFKRDLSMSDADCNLDYLMGEQIIAGSPDEVLRRLLLLIEETGPFGTLVLMSYDWDDKESWVRSLELFARELMPALNKPACGAAAVELAGGHACATTTRSRWRRARPSPRPARPACATWSWRSPAPWRC